MYGHCATNQITIVHLFSIFDLALLHFITYLGVFSILVNHVTTNDSLSMGDTTYTSRINVIYL